MKGVMPEVPQHVLDHRARTGANRWDEMWEGVLHMPPVPNREHQDVAKALIIWIQTHWAAPLGNRVHGPINLASPGGWPSDYRIPDLVLLTPDRFGIDHNEYFEGFPTVVVEIRSPGDETMDKMPFYARLGVPELWIIDRDTRRAELYVLRESQYNERSPGPDGWLHSAATGIRLRTEPASRLAIQLGDDASTRQLLPERR
jgi:Uma2 family endonuclease